MKPDSTQVGSQGGRHIRPFTAEDVPAITALFDAADRADGLYKLASEENIRATFEGIDGVEASAIVAEDASQSDRLLGVGKVSAAFRATTKERIYSVMLRVHPSARAQRLQHTIARTLLEWAQHREVERAG